MKLIAMLALISLALNAQDAPKPSFKEWEFQTTLGASLNWLTSQNYVGVSSSPTYAPALQSASTLKFQKNAHEWRSSLNITEGFIYSPPPSAWVKKADTVLLNSIYLYHVESWWGFFGSLQAKTSIFQGWDQQDKPTQYEITDILTKNVTPVTSQGLQLTQSFLPLTLEEQAGVFAQPLQRKELSLEFRLGAGGRENFASGQKAMTGSANGITQVLALTNVYELGPVAGIVFHGVLLEKKLSYKLNFDTQYTLLQDPVVQPAGSWDRLSFDCTATLSFTLLSWLSLNWNAQALRNPAIVKEVQLLSNLMLAINYAM